MPEAFAAAIFRARHRKLWSKQRIVRKLAVSTAGEAMRSATQGCAGCSTKSGRQEVRISKDRLEQLMAQAKVN